MKSTACSRRSIALYCNSAYTRNADERAGLLFKRDGLVEKHQLEGLIPAIVISTEPFSSTAPLPATRPR